MDKSQIIRITSILNMYLLTATTLLSAGLAAAYDLPDNLKTIYDNHKVCNLINDFSSPWV